MAVRRSPSLALLILLPLLVAAPGTSRAQSRAGAPGGVPIHYEARELSEIVADIGRATGQRFIHGDELRGVVSITVPGRVSREEALELLNAALHLRGFIAIPIEGGVRKIVPVLEAASSAPMVEVELDPRSERAITTMLRLRSVSAEGALEAIKEFAPSGGAMLAYPPSNSLILAGSEAQLRRLITIARAIDRASDESLMTKALRYRAADRVAELVDQVFNDTPIASQRAEIWTDQRTNTIIVQAPSDRLDEIRSFVSDLDRPIAGGGLIAVLPVRNRDVEEVAEILRGLAAPPTANAGRRVPASVAVNLGAELAGRDYSVTVDPPTRSLLVRADPDTLELVSGLVAELDLIPPRISVDVLLFQVTRPSSFVLGIDFFTPAFEPKSRNDFVVFINSNPSGGGIPQQPSPGTRIFGRYARDPLNLTFTDENGQTLTVPISRESASFEAGEAVISTNVLLRPHLVVLSGDEHELFSGNNIPIPVSAAAPTTTAADGTTVQVPTAPLATSQQIERNDVGVRLRIQPTLGQEGVVNLKLEIDLSDVQRSLAGNPEAVGPTLSHSNITTKIPLAPGESAIVGMLTQRGETYMKSGTPFLMSIPVLGYFFSRLERVWVDTELVAVVKARVMRTMDEDIAESIRRRLAFERNSSRVSSLHDLGDAPYAVLLETSSDRSRAEAIADAFAQDGFETRVTSWDLGGREAFDVYLTELESFVQAGSLARQLAEAGWTPEVTVVSRVNELAED